MKKNKNLVFTDAVAEHFTSFSLQLLTAAVNSVETMTLTSEIENTLLAIDGQFTVCGIKLCHKTENPIQL
ncbi:hypothetical protein [Legionella longbeachae]|uniref:hypothetical protein n=1 Tax=Legionella longbeachae TaxID=450 RepID=UPI0012444458|nr:hypothetical protein [Legionella longbeachae]QEY52494.1 hypothetical protein FQU71_15395 [Legionella longbeachae]